MTIYFLHIYIYIYIYKIYYFIYYYFVIYNLNILILSSKVIKIRQCINCNTIENKRFLFFLYG